MGDTKLKAAAEKRLKDAYSADMPFTSALQAFLAGAAYRDHEIKALLEIVKELRDVLALCKQHPTISPLSEVYEVEEIGEKIGYGNLMSLASNLWRSKLEESGIEGGEFSVGPCMDTVELTITATDEKLKELGVQI